MVLVDSNRGKENGSKNALFEISPFLSSFSSSLGGISGLSWRSLVVLRRTHVVEGKFIETLMD